MTSPLHQEDPEIAFSVAQQFEKQAPKAFGDVDFFVSKDDKDALSLTTVPLDFKAESLPSLTRVNLLTMKRAEIFCQESFAFVGKLCDKIFVEVWVGGGRKPSESS